MLLGFFFPYHWRIFVAPYDLMYLEAKSQLCTVLFCPSAWKTERSTETETLPKCFRTGSWDHFLQPPPPLLNQAECHDDSKM